MAAFLQQTIESALANLKPDDEYFIIDGGSTDGSVEIIESYAGRITGWVSEKDEGYADALAKGFELASGDVLCWINAGDLLLPGAFDVARRVLQEEDADFIFGDDFYISEDDRVISFSRGWVRSLRSAMLYGGWTPLQDACFWTKDLYDRVGGINRELKYAADFDLFLRFSMAGKVMYSPYAFSAFRKHFEQKSIANSIEYDKERKSVMSAAIKSDVSDVATKKMFLKLYYWFYLRVRARVLHRLWDKKEFHGRSIKSISVIRTAE